MKKQNQPKTIDSYFTTLIEQSVKATLQRRALQEKEKQDAVSGDSEKPEEKPEAGPEKEKLESGEVSVDDVVEKLNSIR